MRKLKLRRPSLPKLPKMRLGRPQLRPRPVASSLSRKPKKRLGV
jgi:hypothetical protein